MNRMTIVIIVAKVKSPSSIIAVEVILFDLIYLRVAKIVTK